MKHKKPLKPKLTKEITKNTSKNKNSLRKTNSPQEESNRFVFTFK